MQIKLKYRGLRDCINLVHCTELWNATTLISRGEYLRHKSSMIFATCYKSNNEYDTLINMPEKYRGRIFFVQMRLQT